MLRSEFFPAGAFNRLRIRIGSPSALWHGLSQVHAKWLREEVETHRLRLPSHAEILYYKRLGTEAP